MIFLYFLNCGLQLLVFHELGIELLNITYNNAPSHSGTRCRSTFDFGHVTLDISGLRESDSGIYTCKAVNRVGEAVSTCNIKVFGKYFSHCVHCMMGTIKIYYL